jgi:hypothetical protein
MAGGFKAQLPALMTFRQSWKTVDRTLGFVWRTKCQKRGLPHAHRLLWTDLDREDRKAGQSVIIVRSPNTPPYLNNEQLLGDFRELIQSYQKHRHSPRCRFRDEECRFGDCHSRANRTTIRHRRGICARDTDGGDIVPRLPVFLAQFHYIFVSKVFFLNRRYGLKYCPTNSIQGERSLEMRDWRVVRQSVLHLRQSRWSPFVAIGAVT